MTLSRTDSHPIPTWVVSPESWTSFSANLSPVALNWATQHGFNGSAGQAVIVPNEHGEINLALLGAGDEKAKSRQRFIVGAAAAKLPKGTYSLEGLDGDELFEAALAWELEAYRFSRYRTQSEMPALLAPNEAIDGTRLAAFVNAEYLTRDLINTPASDMGPDELEQATRDLAHKFGARVQSVIGDDLLTENFPLIHAVGRASPRSPRLIEMNWGTKGPRLTLVGKGVCFDTGGLDIKPSASMGLMKKDMGGAATVLGLAYMIMSLNMPLQLRVLIPAVENSVAGNAFRPQDVLQSRKGLSVEINNTDAEGRLVLADALAYAAEDEPDFLVSMATLTGAARVAVGPDLAPFYTDDDTAADALTRGGKAMFDPVWRMPFHAPYEALIEPAIADLDNAPSGGMAGSITAALFLRRFASPAYMHFDIYGWQPTAAPGRPKGGAGQGARALLHALNDILDL